ncbi:MAG: VCBS repeat-containing protein [Myxococcota bacterium]
MAGVCEEEVEPCTSDGECDGDRCCAAGPDGSSVCTAFEDAACDAAADACTAPLAPTVPVVRCAWRGPERGSGVELTDAPVSGHVVVANLGLPDRDDLRVPSILFAAGGYLWTIAGSDCSEQLAPLPLRRLRGFAVADLDGDASNELIVFWSFPRDPTDEELTVYQVDALGRAYERLWGARPRETLGTGGPLRVIDLGDPEGPEILAGNGVFTGTGELLTRAPQGRQLLDDLDADERVESVSVDAIWRLNADGASLVSSLETPANGGTFATGHLAHFHEEAVYVARSTSGALRTFDRRGAPVGEATPVPPTTTALGDADGDGQLEVLLSARQPSDERVELVALDSECSGPEPPRCEGPALLRWRADLGPWFRATPVPPTVFDFDADGSPEVVGFERCHLRAFDGRTGEPRWAIGGVHDVDQGPIVADTDGDGRAELVVSHGFLPSPVTGEPQTPEEACPDARAIRLGIACAASEPCPSGLWRCLAGECVATARQTTGIAIYEDRSNRWAPTDAAWTGPRHQPSAFTPAGQPVRRAGAVPGWAQSDDPGFGVARTVGPLETSDPAPDFTVRTLDGWVCDARTQMFAAAVCNRGASDVTSRWRLRARFRSGDETLCDVPIGEALSAGACAEVTCRWEVGDAEPRDVVVEVRANDAGAVECRPTNNAATFSASACVVE